MKSNRKSKKIIISLFCLIIIFSFVILYKGIAKLQRVKAEQEEIADYIELSETAFSTVGNTDSQFSEYDDNIYNDVEIPVETETSLYGPVVPRESAMDFTALQEQYPDIVGWIYCKDTLINYPIMQCGDNDFYLHHLYDGREGANGSIFLDCFCASDFSDCNSILYGHNMASGQMFHSINGYKFQHYYDTFPEMTLYTPYGDYRVAMLAGFIYSEPADINVEFLECEDADRLLEYFEWAKSVSTFKSAEDVEEGDRILSLVTCTYEYENARYVLHGKLIPD